MSPTMNAMSEHIELLATALAKAQASIEPAKKSSVNPYFKSRYADLATVWDTARHHLTSNGIAVSQTLEIEEGFTVLVTTLMHSSGQWIRSRYRVQPVKNDPQSLGSAIQYARRYSFAAICMITTEDDDDDGNAAANNTPKRDHQDPPPEKDQRKQRALVANIIMQIAQATTTDDLRRVWEKNHHTIREVPADALDQLVQAKEEAKERLMEYSE